MKIEVVYATPDLQKLIVLDVDEGTTARAAVLASRLDDYFPELQLAAVPIGVFGEVVGDDYALLSGDRVELYRELVIDPKESRRRRAANPRPH